MHRYQNNKDSISIFRQIFRVFPVDAICIKLRRNLE